MRRGFAMGLMLAALSACSNRSSGGGQPGSTASGAGAATPTAHATAGKGGAPSATVEITPASPHASDTLVAQGHTTSASALLRYQWYVNGSPVGSADRLSPGSYKKGQKVAVEVTAVDTSGAASAPARAEVTIVNSAPVVGGSPLQQSSSGGRVTFQVSATDPDGDPLTYALAAPVAGVTLTGNQLVVTTSSIPSAGLNAQVVVSDPEGAKGTSDLSIGRH